MSNITNDILELLDIGVQVNGHVWIVSNAYINAHSVTNYNIWDLLNNLS